MIKYVIKYDQSLPVDKLYSLANFLSKSHPKEEVIFIPQTYIFETFSIEQMIQVRDQMTKIIEDTQK